MQIPPPRFSKNTAENSPITPLQAKKFNVFFLGGVRPPHRWTQPSLLDSPLRPPVQPDLHPCTESPITVSTGVVRKRRLHAGV